MNQMWVVLQTLEGRSIRAENFGFCTINCRPNADAYGTLRERPYFTYVGFSVKSFYWTGALDKFGLIVNTSNKSL